MHSFLRVLAIALAIVVSFSRNAYAEPILTYEWIATVDLVSGAPFGLTFNGGETISGSFSYDLGTLPSATTPTGATFPAGIFDRANVVGSLAEAIGMHHQIRLGNTVGGDLFRVDNLPDRTISIDGAPGVPGEVKHPPPEAVALV